MRHPRLLLLDESTSSLDAESEQQFQDSLEKISSSMTIVAIVHRLHTIQKVQQIFMIEGGNVSSKVPMLNSSSAVLLTGPMRFPKPLALSI